MFKLNNFYNTSLLMPFCIICITYVYISVFFPNVLVLCQTTINDVDTVDCLYSY